LNLTDGISSIAVGDEITVHGYFKNYYGTIEMATNNTNSTYVTVVKVGADEPVIDPDEDTETDSIESDTDAVESDTAETNSIETDPVESDSIETENETEAVTNGKSDKTEGGCGSSIAGGAVIISVACAIAVTFVRKKRD
jgi:hypothetical protein